MAIKYGAIGVGLLLFLDGRILTVKELKSKPEINKEAGMISFPLETLEKEDLNPAGTINRLLWEELGISSKQIYFWGIAPSKFNFFPKRKDITTFYGVAKFLGNPGHLFIPKDDDIAISGWKTPAELLSIKNPRVEVQPIITHFLKTHLAEFRQ